LHQFFQLNKNNYDADNGHITGCALISTRSSFNLSITDKIEKTELAM